MIRMAFYALLGIAVVCQALADEQPRNLIANGGFEKGIESWNYGQWRGLPQPGFIDHADVCEGQSCFVMGLTGVEETRNILASAVIDPAKDYELRLVLRGVDLPENSVWVALLQWGTEKTEKESPQGWVWIPEHRYAKDLITAGGSFAWNQFDLHIYRQGIKPTTNRVDVYIGRNSLSQNELSIDAVSLVPVAPIEYEKPAAPAVSQTAKAPAAITTPQQLPPHRSNSPVDRAPAKLLLLDRCDSTERWSLNLGREFPGARGELTEDSLDGRDSLKLAFDLSAGGRYGGAQTSIDLMQSESLVCNIRRSAAGYFIARVTDATGQVHAAGFRTKGNQWETIELRFDKDVFHSHWGGADDGKIHFPLRQVLIAASSTNGEQGAFWLRDLAVKAPVRNNTWQIVVETDQPGQIHFIDGPGVRVTATVDNRLPEARLAPLSIEVLDLEHHRIASRTVETRFAPWERQTIDLSLDPPGPGYFLVVVTIGGDAGRETGEGSFGVVRRPPRFRQRVPDSFFAMHVSDPEVAARIGVHFTRHFHFWQYTEYHQGQYEHATEYVDACRAAGIDVMMCLDYREPSWLKPRTGEDGLPTPDALHHYATWVRDAVRTHAGVAVFEIQNEPDLELGRSRNLALEKGVEFYSLFRGDSAWQPMPGAVAYANVAWHLDHCRPINSFRLAGDVCVSVFERLEDGGAVAALWSTDRPFCMATPLPADAEAFGLFGRSVPLQNIPLDPSPVFVKTSTTSAAALTAMLRQADVRLDQPFDVVAVSPFDVNTLRVGLINRTLSTIPVQCRVGDRSKRLILPGVSGTVWSEISLQIPLTAHDPQKPLELVLSAADNEPRTIRVPTDVLPVTRCNGIVVDGDTNDWHDQQVLRVDTKGCIYPPDPAGWRGPQDLSVQASFAWDSDNLYVLVRVVDDRHVADRSSDLREGDNLQIAIDVNNDTGLHTGYDDNDREYGIVFDGHEARIVQMYPGDPGDSSRVAAKRFDDKTVYELAFPWSSLGRIPRAGLIFSLNFVANENDGAGPKYAMGLTPGISQRKQPGIYRDFYLAE